VKTKAELIEGLTTLQLDRNEANYAFTDREREDWRNKKYWGFHDDNAKLSTQEIKRRIMQELIWKSRKGMNYGTTT